VPGAGRTTEDPWSVVGEALAGHGWRWRALAVERLPDLTARVTAAIEGADLPPTFAAELTRAARVELPAKALQPRSIVVGALARPVTQAILTVDGGERTVVVPPHYAGYYETPRRFAALVAETLGALGRRAAQARLPLKTLAVAVGLARYGANNIAYVDGLGSYLQLAACVTDLPAPDDAVVLEAQRLGRCGDCSACRHACPTGAIPGDRFVLRADRCLTAVNESEEPFPEWVDPAWHACAVGCLRCQLVCPENAPVTLRVEPPRRFDGRETVAILAAAQPSTLAAETRAKLAACGLDYAPSVIARNLLALLSPANA
jgi:epoxyqueuosine reductase